MYTHVYVHEHAGIYIYVYIYTNAHTHARITRTKTSKSIASWALINGDAVIRQEKRYDKHPPLVLRSSSVHAACFFLFLKGGGVFRIRWRHFFVCSPTNMMITATHVHMCLDC